LGEREEKEVEKDGYYWQDGGFKDNICARNKYYATQWNNATLVCNSTDKADFAKTRVALMRFSALLQEWRIVLRSC
jgi:hypothetical protein